MKRTDINAKIVREINFILVQTDAEYEIAKKIFLEYVEELGFDLCFQNFEEELKFIKTQYGKPKGGIILLKSNNDIIGCIGVKKFENCIVELKRMFIKKKFRNKGYGKKLLDKAIELAIDLKYERLRLDTLPIMNKAIELYKKAGFVEIEPYRYNPIPGAKYFELTIE